MGRGFKKLYSDFVLPLTTVCLGDKVIYRPKKGGTFDIYGVFDERFLQVDPDTEEVVASNIPNVGIRLKDIPFTPEQGDEVEVFDTKYLVTDSQEDGLGGSTLLLHRK